MEEYQGPGKEAIEKLVLEENVEITANRLVVGVVKKKCVDNWRGVHARFIGHLDTERE